MNDNGAKVFDIDDPFKDEFYSPFELSGYV